MTEFQLHLNCKCNVWLRKASGTSLSMGPLLVPGHVSNVDLRKDRVTQHGRDKMGDCFLLIVLTIWCLKPYQRWLLSLTRGRQLANRADKLPPCAQALGWPPPQDFGQNLRWKDSKCDPSRDLNRAAPAWSPQIPMRTRPGVPAGGQEPRAPPACCPPARAHGRAQQRPKQLSDL